MAMKLVILHSNDLHGHLTPWQGWEVDLKGKPVGRLARLAAAIANVRREEGDTMLADLTQQCRR